MRGYLALGCTIFTIPVFGLLAFTDVYPLVSTLWLGTTYSFAAVSIHVFPKGLGLGLGFVTDARLVK